MLRILSVGMLSLTALVSSLSIASAATVYDFATDYSTSINTNSSTWSYRSGTAHNGSYQLLDQAPGTGPGFGGTWSPGPSATVNQGWQLSTTTGLNIVPYVGKNLTGVPQTFTPGGVFVWPANKMVVHPDSGELVVISWLSSADGTVDIASRVADAHIGGGANSGVNYFIDRNAGVGANSLTSGTVLEAGDSGPISLSGISVSAGDRINFVVGLQNVLNANGTYLDATITFSPLPAPEPSSLLLASLGIVVCGACRRRNRSCKINS